MTTHEDIKKMSLEELRKKYREVEMRILYADNWHDKTNLLYLSSCIRNELFSRGEKP